MPKDKYFDPRDLVYHLIETKGQVTKEQLKEEFAGQLEYFEINDGKLTAALDYLRAEKFIKKYKDGTYSLGLKSFEIGLIGSLPWKKRRSERIEFILRIVPIITAFLVGSIGTTITVLQFTQKEDIKMVVKKIDSLTTEIKSLNNSIKFSNRK